MIYFNEHEPYAADWLGNLWPHATVDRRSIHDVSPSDLAGVTRAHFFAGIGGWEYALELAGWPATRPVWTGSCPCQPFSAAGKRKGADDERHLWPEWFRLIRECRPPILFGEQVSSRLGREWFAGVRADLEGLGYVVGAADLCAASCGAPHIRQRLYFGGIRLADAAHGDGWGGERGTETSVGAHGERRRRLAGGGVAGGAWSASLWLRCLDGRYRRVPARRVADTLPAGRAEGRAEPGSGPVAGGITLGGVDDAESKRPQDRLAVHGEHEWQGAVDGCELGSGDHGEAYEPEPGLFPLAHGVSGRMGRLCPDPETFPLAHGATNRVGRLRAYGNGIVPPLAAAFVRAFLDAVSDVSAECDHEAA